MNGIQRCTRQRRATSGIITSSRGFAYGIKVHIGEDKASGMIHSVETTTANVHDITQAAQLLHGEEDVVYGYAGYQGIDKRAEIADKSITFRVAMRPGKRRVLPKTPDGRLLDLVETALAAGFCLQ